MQIKREQFHFFRHRWKKVTAQIAPDLFENKESTRSLLLQMSTTGISYGHMFDAVIG